MDIYLLQNKTVDKYVPSMNSSVFFFPVPPAVVVFPANITTVEGSTVVLPCTAEGYPTPHVTWIDPNGTVLENRTSDTNLTLPNVSRHSSGTYQCNATNELGSDSATVKLDVWCKFSFLSFQLQRKFPEQETLWQQLREKCLQSAVFRTKW